METQTTSIYTCLRNWTLKLVLYPSCEYLIGFQYFIWLGTDTATTDPCRLDRPDSGTVTLNTMHTAQAALG
jgi:hypothetical protein